MAITFTQGANIGSSATDASSSFATSSITLPSTGLACIWVGTEVAAGNPGLATMTGCGVTWTRIVDVLVTLNRIQLFAANCSGNTGAGALTVSYTGTASGHETHNFYVAGADEANGVVQCFVQVPTNSGSGTGGQVDLSAAANTEHRAISCFQHIANEGSTFRTNWTENADSNHASPNTGMESQYRTDAFETTATATWTTSSGWIGIAAEIKAAAGNFVGMVPI